jgi:hypothetical protein
MVTGAAQLRPHLNPTIGGIQHRTLRCLDALEEEEQEEVRAPHTFRISRRRSDGQVVLHYKELAAHPVWLPPIDPTVAVLETDPEGIEIFNSPPPDPMKSPPEEVPLHSIAAAKKEE